MQTLTAGSFLNLENASTVEALKFTARRLAEMTTAVAAAENLNTEALKNLANDLWQKAEYVARETERRRLQEIFLENFCERFRELKPEVSAEITSLEVQQNISAASNNDSAAPPPIKVESVSTPDLPEDDTAEAQEKRDEFLGFVESGEPFVRSFAAETNAAAATAMQDAPEKTEQEEINAATEDEPVAGEKISTDIQNDIKSQSTAVAAVPVADAKDNPPPSPSAIKNNTTAPKSADAKEPFEFGKCTVNLSLTLLPSIGDGRGRRAIVSAASHNLPPEIEFLEIGEGEDLTEIAALVSGKLARLKQTLPAKYIEQLRQSKTKTAKKPATTKTSIATPAPTKPEIVAANGEKTSGEQQTQNL
ncbi:MAG: hypothetical protein LH614_10205, partial [Pyrinomonadaceae bacterium]|nr:hypothetical protein [Pyrinomonadaceae bacterium]